MNIPDWLERFKIVAGLAAALAGVFGTGWSSYQFMEARYALAKDVALVGMRVDQKISEDRRNQLQSRIWKLEDRYGFDCAKCPPEVKDEYRRLKDAMRQEDETINLLKRQYLEMQGQK